MKQKLFLLLTALAISIGTLWAQTSTTTNYTWDELYQEPYEALSGSTTTMYKYVWARGGEDYPAFWFYILFRKSEMVTYNGRTYPAKGDYTISSNLSNPNVIPNYQVANTESGSSTKCIAEYDVSGSRYYYPIGGSGRVVEGADLPYITYSATSNKNASGNTVTSGQYQKIYVNIGTAATYYNVNVNRNDNSMGTVSYVVKSGYVYEVDGTYAKHWKKNSVYTLTATPQPGYQFDHWSDGGAQSHDITITGDATYTAYFVALGGQQYDISTAVSPAGAGTVSGAGTYYENTSATLTATSSNEHLYFFDHWEVGGSTYAGGATITPTVIGEATYTAFFRTASNGTITANTSLPAGGSVIVNQPSTAGGTAVTLTVNVNEGYTFTGWADGGDDNPRTVYVDGDHTYTAQIVEGVTIDVQAALNTNHGFGWGYCFYYWAKAYGYDIMIRAIDNWSWAAGDNMGISDINTSESYINDHGVTVRFTAFTATCYNQNGKKVLDATATGNNGKNYHLILRGVTADSDDTAEAYNQSFTSGQTSIRDGMDNVSDIKWFRAQNGTGESYSTTWCSHLFFKLDQTQCGTIPSGIYPINDTQQAGTVVSTAGSNNQSYGSYYVQSYLYYVPVTGWVEVVNRDEQYYVYADAYNSRGYDYKTTYGTTPYSVTVSSNSNSYGSAGIVWHSSNCGDVAYGAGTQKFFNGNTITLTATANSGYEFWRWSDEDASVVNSVYGTSRNVTVSGNLTLQAIFREEATNHTVSITAPENGTITVSYNNGSAQSFTSGSRDIAEGTVLTVTTTPAADYHFGAWTNDGAASVTVNGDKTIGATFAQNDYFLNATYGAGGASVTRSDNGNNLTVKRAGNTVTLTPTAANGYTFLSWGGTDAAKISNNIFTFPANGTHNTTYNVQANFQATTYNLTYNGLEGATHSNPATYTIETATITLTDPSARTGYTFTGWTCGGEAITEIAIGSTGDKTITANWQVNSHTVTIVSSNAEYGTVDVATVENVTHGATITTDGNTVTIDGTTVTATPAIGTGYTFTFDGWTNGTATVNADLTVTANFSRTTNTYTLRWMVNGEELTGEGFTHGTVAYGTPIVAPANPTPNGYVFSGWTPAVKATMPAADVTYTAVWAVTLLDNENDTYYNEFKEKYNNKTVKATYNRTFKQNNWATLTLPFDVNRSIMTTQKLSGSVYEFKYATGDAADGSTVTLNFSKATTMNAGQCYIVNANSATAAKSSFTFSNVLVNLSKDNVETLADADDYDDLVANINTTGDIELVGTLRKGILIGGNKYMGLKDNKIYYPNTSVGNLILAYRGLFRLTSNAGNGGSGAQGAGEDAIAPMPIRFRMVVDGEDMGELEALNGELTAPAETRKFIRDGVLYIERDGVIYDAQGKRVE